MQVHPSLSLPDDPDVVLSRYLSLGKLLDLLSSKNVFLSKVSNLGDTFEGSLTQPEFDARREEIDVRFWKEPRSVEKSMQKFTRLLLENTFVNCWTLGEIESEAMWRLYCAGEEGVCIRTSLSRLQKTVDDPRVYATQIRYLDYKHDRFPSGNTILGPFTCKRLAFEHEREFRLLISNIPPDYLDDDSGPVDIPDVSDDNPTAGIRVAVDPNLLIEAILTSPFAPDWYQVVVKEAIERYCPTLPVMDSSLSGQPLY
jgi:hypothetical protein